MLIRPAKSEDIDQIVEICKSAQISRTDSALTGLVEYAKTREELLMRLNPHFLVAESNKILGYSLAIPYYMVEAKDTPCNKYIRQRKNYLWADQLAVRDPTTIASSRAAVALVDTGLALAKDLDEIIAFIAQKPFNIRSHSLSMKKGFVPQEFVTSSNGILVRAYIRKNR